MASHENKELTKKVLNALDPKYILGQGQQGKITNVFRKFRERTQDLKTIAQKAAITGKKHLEKLSPFKNGIFSRKKGGNKTRKLSNTSANSMRK